jgi:GlpG protein
MAMRMIGHLAEESSARAFSEYLYVNGIDNQLDFTQGEGWAVWVNEEGHLETASKLLEEFRRHPADPKFRTEKGSAEKLRAEQAREQEAWRRRLRNRRHLFRPLTAYGFGPLTFVMITISVAVFLLSDFGRNLLSLQSFTIVRFWADDTFVSPYPDLPEIRQGEIWRLFTPMFIHFDPLHILFNMLWLRDLGSMIEARQGSGHLAALALVTAIGSNLAQYYLSLHHFPNFGGMSGVVYALLGYIWLRGKFDPASGLYLHSSTVIMMLIWMAAGFAGAFHMANMAHLGGLLLGMAWGFLSSLRPGLR